ncbi:MAG: DUF4912 domain-containing protein [Terrimicrobiaceae bacterium]
MKKAIAGKKEGGAFQGPDSAVGEGAVPAERRGDVLPPMDDLGDLPRSYGTDSIFLVAQEPHWLFTYWDIDISLHPGGKTFLRVSGDGDVIESEIEVPFETRNWYIPVNEAGVEYTVEIGYYRGSQWNAIARSITVRTPKDKVSESDDFHYATIPLHLSFQKLMENIRTTIQGGETLMQALGRLQRDGRLFALAHGGGRTISPDERVVLEALLGKSLLDELTGSVMNSEELGSRIQKHLQERLNSEGASEFLARIPVPPESSLFSAFSSLAGPSSWSSAALSSWASGALASWAAAIQSSSAPGETSWGSAAQSSWGAAVLSSWLAAAQASGAGSSWNAAALSSWLQAATSSWSGAALSSWSQAAMSSWSHVETSSWGGSENVGSFGFAQREFFMHVNAEVIFYGGTDPRAKVEIGGKPVDLASDGSFRYHFVFPDGNYEIPITATSPDGVETRSATLRFERTTARAGDVGHTAQPPLPVPMGVTV